MLFLVPQADEWTRFRSVSQRLDVDRSLFAFVNAMEATRTRYAPKDIFDDADVVAVDTVEIKKTIKFAPCCSSSSSSSTVSSKGSFSPRRPGLSVRATVPPGAIVGARHSKAVGSCERCDIVVVE